MANAYMDKIEAFVRANEENVIRDIKRLVDIPSVAGTPEPGAPNGAGPAAALKEALALAGEMGLATGEFEGHMGWAELPGSTDKQIATITHMDVVPAGNGWTGDPFNMRVQDGWLIGRGVADDKGPGVLCLYALKFLKENNVPLKYSVRALLGTSEETGMEDIDRYLAGNRAPDFCFSPDAEFPVCNGEKGHFRADLVSPVCGGQVLAFEGGVAFNAVPDRAAALVRAEGLLPAENITLEPGEEAGTVWVRGWGKSGHAAMPEGTRNAIGLVVDYLLANKVGNEAETAYFEVLHKLHASTDGSALGIAADDGLFTPLTVIGGTMKMENGRMIQSVDSRFPTNTTGESIRDTLTAVCGSAAAVENVGIAVPFYIAADAAPIRALIDTYNEVTGENAQPFTMGGGTYARHFPLAVSFGPERQDLQLPEFAGPMHGANEGAKIEHLMQALKIYILALVRLQEIDL